MIFTIHTTNVQLWMVLDGFHCPTSAWLEARRTQTIDLSLNIDFQSRSGASAPETKVCYRLCTGGHCERSDDQRATSGYLRP